MYMLAATTPRTEIIQLKLSPAVTLIRARKARIVSSGCASGASCCVRFVSETTVSQLPLNVPDAEVLNRFSESSLV
jgi:hypothetical protein